MKIFKIFALMIWGVLPMKAENDLVESLAGQWQLTASPFEGGVSVIEFTATLSDDASSLLCHSDEFYKSASRSYPMDWTLKIEQDGGQVRLGWVLTKDEPSSAVEFQEPVSAYTIGGAAPDDTHRYIYLLSENIETSKLDGMTLWSGYQGTATATFAFPQTYQLYAVVSRDKPYVGYAVGYIDIWASAKINRVGDTGISMLNSQGTTHDDQSAIYNLNGQRVEQPGKGLYIVNGRKILVK